MKKLYIIGLLFGMSFASCSDFLDKMPSTSLPVEEAITTMTDLQNAVNGIGYLMSEGRMTYSADFAIFADLRGEDFYAISNNNQAGPIARYTMTKYDQEPYYAYAYFYQAIANVNKVLSTIDNIAYTEDEKVTYDDLKGQLYAWRAMLHFDLARMFCHIPTAVDDVNAANSGLVLSTGVYETDYVGTRSTLKETYDQILADFNTALPLLSKDKNNGYINYWAALALRSRAYLYNGQYNLALADAKEVMGCSLYKLYTRDNYVESWSKTYTDESIFELSITTNYNAQRNSVGYYCDSEGYAECAFVETAPLYQYLSTHPEDIRSQMIKDQSGDEFTYPAKYPAKYPGRDNNISVNNPKIIRLSEVYLIAAEAAFHVQPSEAAGYINTLRKQRIENYSDVSSVSLEDILMERRIELFAENSISFDYWRNRMSVNNFYVGTVAYNDYRTVLPIPQDEIDLSGDKLIQNPEY